MSSHESPKGQEVNEITVESFEVIKNEDQIGDPWDDAEELAVEGQRDIELGNFDTEKIEILDSPTA